MTDETKTQKTEYRLMMARDLNSESTSEFRSRITWILGQPDFGALTVLFSSEGGSTDQSLALYNTLRALPCDVHMHAVGHVGSAAIPVFLSGARRTCTPLSRFFVHEYDWGFVGRQTLNRMTEAVQRLQNDIELARNVIRDRTKADDHILDALSGRAAPSILDADRAKAMDFVHDICELGQSNGEGMNVRICVT